MGVPLYKDYKIKRKGKCTYPNPTGNRKLLKHNNGKITSTKKRKEFHFL